MIRIIILVVFSFAFTCSSAQENLIARVKTEEGTRLSTPSEIKTANSEKKKYVFKVYGDSGIPKGEVESHFLGNEIAVKWTLVNELYLKKSNVSIGFGSSYTETLKPSILNAVYRMNAYYKKALNRKTISEVEAKKQYSWILDCAIAICHCPETDEFEKALTKTKEPDEIVSLFNSVILDKN
jgi:hypothetical protein